MKCFFGHDWIYKEKVEAHSKNNLSIMYEKRFCSKCGKIQENNAYFDTSFGMENVIRNNWVTVGYLKPDDVKGIED